jgi:hypothetical protein
MTFSVNLPEVERLFENVQMSKQKGKLCEHVNESHN